MPNFVKKVLSSKSKIFLASLLFFILGTALFLWLRLNVKLLIFFIASVLLFTLAFIWRKDLKVRFFALIFACLFLGFGYSLLYFQSILADPLPNFDQGEVEFQGYVCAEPDHRLDQSKYEICLLRLKIEDWQKVNFKILITTDLYPEYEYGEMLEGDGKLKKPEKFEDFDYKNYLLSKRIFALMYRPEIKQSKVTKKTNNNIVRASASESRTRRGPLLHRSVANAPFESKNNDQIVFVESRDLGIIKYSFFKTKYYLLKIKKRFESTINQTLSEPESSLLAGLILGSKRGFSDEMMDNFNATGTTHIIALSGFNITIIIWFIDGLLINIGRKKRFIISFMLVLFFVVLSGAMASVVRAATMSFLVLAAPLLGRKAKQGNVLIFVAVLMLIFNPMILRYDLGFLLSFFALLGLIYMAPLIEKAIQKIKYVKKLPEISKKPLIETLSAQAIAVPLILYNFDRISLIAPVTNVLILPLIPLTMALGFIVGLIGMISIFFGQIAAWFPFVFLKYMIVIIESFAKIPLASVEIKKIHYLWFFLYYFIIVLVILYGQKKISKIKQK